MDLNVEQTGHELTPVLNSVNVPEFAATQKSEFHVRLQPTAGWAQVNLRELWAYRELLFFLMWRDIKVRYKQTALGASWAIIQPFCMMVVFTVFFGRMGKMAEGLAVPYPIWSFSALVPWFFFAGGLIGASNSIVLNARLVKKIYFPRLTLPIATVLSNAVDMLIAFAVLLGMMVYYRIVPTVNIIWLPAFVLLAYVTSIGVGLWAAAINVKYRDVKHAMPFITQFWLFATPIAWQSRKLPEPWLTLYGLNPMAGVVEGFRWALLGETAAPAPGAMVAVSCLAALALLVSGAVYFCRMEKTFADIV